VYTTPATISGVDWYEPKSSCFEHTGLRLAAFCGVISVSDEKRLPCSVPL
jgi:hypothetical protein